MTDPEVLEQLAARRAELDGLEEQRVKQLAEVRSERDELAVTERVLLRMAEQIAAERDTASSPVAHVAGRAVRLVPDRAPGVAESALPADDATAARRDKLVEHLKAAGLGALADPGFLGVDKPDDPDDLVTVTGYKATRARKLTTGQKQANRILAAGRAPVEHGFDDLKAWRVLTKLRTAPPALPRSCVPCSS